MPVTELGGALMPADLATACKRHSERQRGDWLAQPTDGNWPVSVALRCPSDRQAAAAPAAMRTWLSAWARFDQGCQENGRHTAISWRSVNWRVMGNVSLPEKVLFNDADAVVDCAGMRQSWDPLNARWKLLCEAFSQMVGRRECVRALITAGGWSDEDFARLVAFLGWGARNSGSGVYLRQLPLIGIHTKWVETRGAVIVPFLQAVRGESGDVYQLLGLKRAPETVRMRLLDPALREQLGGAEDLQMPVTQWSALLKRPPKRLLVVENLATGLAMPEMKETAVAMGLGNNGTVLEGIAWAHQAQILYWGDIDTWGLHILSRVRGVLPQVRSILMTEAVMESHRDLWTEEPSLDTSRAPYLTVDEARLLEDLLRGRWGARARLEQERIHWPSALEALAHHWAAWDTSCGVHPPLMP